MVRNNFMMHICTVATLCFPEKTVPRNYYYCVQDDNSLSLCFKSMYRTLFVAIFTSTFIFSMYDHFLVCLDAFSHTYRNINISNQYCQSYIFVVCSGRLLYFVQSSGPSSSAYCLLALHLKLVFAVFSFASATTLLPALLVGYLCFTPLSSALQMTLQRYFGVSFTNVLCTAATE